MFSSPIWLLNWLNLLQYLPIIPSSSGQCIAVLKNEWLYMYMRCLYSVFPEEESARRRRGCSINGPFLGIYFQATKRFIQFKLTILSLNMSRKPIHSHPPPCLLVTSENTFSSLILLLLENHSFHSEKSTPGSANNKPSPWFSPEFWPTSSSIQNEIHLRTNWPIFTHLKSIYSQLVKLFQSTQSLVGREWRRAWGTAARSATQSFTLVSCVFIEVAKNCILEYL